MDEMPKRIIEVAQQLKDGQTPRRYSVRDFAASSSIRLLLVSKNLLAASLRGESQRARVEQRGTCSDFEEWGGISFLRFGKYLAAISDRPQTACKWAGSQRGCRP
jgi:hypothetical protein